VLPPGHKLDVLQRKWRALDRPLAGIARLVFKKYPQAAAIDIGANIGDSAALISRHVTPRLLCIEGSKEFMPWLSLNAVRIGPHVSVCDALVGKEGESVTWAKPTSRSTAALRIMPKVMTPAVATVSTRSLSSILHGYPMLDEIKLVKCDTDGFDFKILLGAQQFLNQHKPVLFFEYDPSLSKRGEEDATECIDALTAIGYRRFAIFDNFGNFLITITNAHHFMELNAYLRSNRAHGIAIYYFDVCAFAEGDEDLFESLRLEQMASAQHAGS
jgi:FkbM family methyltransferase